MPAGSKTDLLLAKTEPISNGGTTSVVTYLRRGGARGGTCCGTPPWDRGLKICKRNNSAYAKGSEERGGGGAPGTRAEIALQPMVKTMVEGGDILNQFMNHTVKSCEAQYIAKDVPLRKLYFYDHLQKQEVDIGKTDFLG
ncbi:protein pxr1-like [Limosa lapponica baueri]|uniref:Protein pxr1-like n=1 Tax=Limosa lapponica baueri TaxID=1758121 RepID=A0A2I0UDQ2_LIMLA|nr:protein pxr1-like [Limosa lapponica baueri]